MADPRIQLVIRRSDGKTQYDYSSLTLLAYDAMELEELVAAGKADEILGQFFDAQALENVKAAFPQAEVVSNTPNCPKCQGKTEKKETKTGKTYFVCLQEKGKCMESDKNGKEWATKIWQNTTKGRDS